MKISQLSALKHADKLLDRLCLRGPLKFTIQQQWDDAPIFKTHERAYDDDFDVALRELDKELCQAVTRAMGKYRVGVIEFMQKTLGVEYDYDDEDNDEAAKYV